MHYLLSSNTLLVRDRWNGIKGGEVTHFWFPRKKPFLVFQKKWRPGLSVRFKAVWTHLPEELISLAVRSPHLSLLPSNKSSMQTHKTLSSPNSLILQSGSSLPAPNYCHVNSCQRISISHLSVFLTILTKVLNTW